MTKLQRNFFTFGIILLGISLLSQIILHSISISNLSQGAASNLSALLIAAILVFFPLFLTFVLAILIRVLSAQTEGIGFEVFGLIWFALLFTVAANVGTAISSTIISRILGSSQEIIMYITIRNYSGNISAVLDGIATVLLSAAMGMQIYEKKLTTE